MTASEQMVARARAAAALRDGERVKVRLPAELHRRAQACARAAGLDLAEFSAIACRTLQPDPDDAPCTRAGSLAVWLRSPPGLPHAQIRAALRAAVDRAEPLNPPPPADTLMPPGSVPGIHYLLEPAEED